MLIMWRWSSGDDNDNNNEDDDNDDDDVWLYFDFIRVVILTCKANYAKKRRSGVIDCPFILPLPSYATPPPPLIGNWITYSAVKSES